MARIRPAGRIGQQVGAKPPRDSKTYEDSAVQQQQKQTTNTQQKAQLQSNISKLQADLKVAHKDYEGAVYSLDKIGRRKAQADKKRINKEIEVLNQSLAGLQKGGYYQDISKVTSTAKEAGRIVEAEQYDKFSRARESEKIRQAKAKQKAETVFIDGLGYTVKPELQKEFISKMGKPSPTKDYSFASTITQPSKFEKAIGVTLVRGAPSLKKSCGNIQFEKLREISFIKTAREKIKESEFAKTLEKIKLPTPPKREPEKGVEKVAKVFVTPKGVKSLFDVGGEFTLRGGEWFSDVTKKPLIFTGIVSPESWMFKPTPIKRETAKEVISSVYMWSAFAPFMKTGTAQIMESEYAGQVVEVMYKGKKVKMTLEQAQKLGLTGTRLQATSEFARASQERQLDILKKAFKGRVYLDKVSMQKDAIRASKFMKEAGLTNIQIKGLLLKLFPKTSPTTTVLVKETAGGILGSTATIPTMKSVGLVGATVTTTGAFQPSQVGKTQWISKSKTLQKTGVFSLLKTGQGILQKSKSNVLQQTKSGQDILQQTKIAQDMLQPTVTITSQIPKAKPITKSLFKPTLPTRGLGIDIMKPSPIKKGLIIPFGFPSLKAPKGKKKQQGYIPQAKSKGKWKNLSKKPLTREAALGRMSRTMDNTLSAQGRIRKVKGKASTQRDAYFGTVRHKLRPYKIRKGIPIKMHNRWIEKRGSRADTLGEQKGLRVAKFIKQRNWLSPTSKKKTKQKSPWLF